MWKKKHYMRTETKDAAVGNDERVKESKWKNETKKNVLETIAPGI